MTKFDTATTNVWASRMLLSGGYDRQLCVWDATTNHVDFKLQPHDAWLTALSVNSACQWIMTCSQDGRARFWSVKDLEATPGYRQRIKERGKVLLVGARRAQVAHIPLHMENLERRTHSATAASAPSQRCSMTRARCTTLASSVASLPICRQFRLKRDWPFSTRRSRAESATKSLRLAAAEGRFAGESLLSL